MRAVGMVLHAQLRQHGKSWLALAVLVALVGGLVMAAAVTARRDRGRVPGFLARYGYDAVVYSSPAAAVAGQDAASHPGHAGPGPVGRRGRLRLLRKPIDASGSPEAFELAPADLGRTVKLRRRADAGPVQPGRGPGLRTRSPEDSGVRVGSVIQVLEPTRAQISQVEAQERPPAKVSWRRCRGTASG